MITALFAAAAFLFGFVVACMLGARHSDRLEQDKRDLARQLALAVGHPSSRPAGRVLRVVGSDGAAVPIRGGRR